MELHSNRLKLLPCTIETVAAFSDSDYTFGPHIESYIEELSTQPDLLGWGVWLAIDKTAGTVIGDMGFKGKPDKAGKVEMGYGIIPSEQNKGYATEAIHCLLEWAFNSGQVGAVTAECHEDNAPSIRVLNKVGMEVIQHKEDMIYWLIKKV
ncbi:MAG: GNAT family N-acetyltransferase [Alkalibacterium sp.]|nr:GNAT family N-acetyltransferase [Alkalibacterium sp.]